MSSFVHPHSLGRRHGIFCGDVGPYAHLGRGHQCRTTYEIGTEGVRRAEAAGTGELINKRIALPEGIQTTLRDRKLEDEEDYRG